MHSLLKSSGVVTVWLLSHHHTQISISSLIIRTYTQRKKWLNTMKFSNATREWLKSTLILVLNLVLWMIYIINFSRMYMILVTHTFTQNDHINFNFTHKITNIINIIGLIIPKFVHNLWYNSLHILHKYHLPFFH